MDKPYRHTLATKPGRDLDGSTEGRLRAFLAGDSDGNDLLHALYSHILDEPIPERLHALVRR
jgi:hypothetical protein